MVHAFRHISVYNQWFMLSASYVFLNFQKNLFTVKHILYTVCTVHYCLDYPCVCALILLSKKILCNLL